MSTVSIPDFHRLDFEGILEDLELRAELQSVLVADDVAVLGARRMLSQTQLRLSFWFGVEKHGSLTDFDRAWAGASLMSLDLDLLSLLLDDEVTSFEFGRRLHRSVVDESLGIGRLVNRLRVQTRRRLGVGSDRGRSGSPWLGQAFVSGVTVVEVAALLVRGLHVLAR